MRLRLRLAQALIARLTEYLPPSEGSVWDGSNTICTMETLEFEFASGVVGEWQQTARLTGAMRVDLHGDGLEDRSAEALISNLLDDPLLLAPDDEIAVEQLSEQVRAVLMEWRETRGESGWIATLRLHVNGSLVRKIAAQPIHEVYAGQAPDIGIEHIDDYYQIDPS